MGRLRLGVVASLVSGAGLLLCGPALRVSAQAPSQAPAAAAAPAPPTKSVYGKLLSVDTTLSNVLMTEDGGAKLAWHFDAPVIAEAARFKPGDPLIVIYRQSHAEGEAGHRDRVPGHARSRRSTST